MINSKTGTVKLSSVILCTKVPNYSVFRNYIWGIREIFNNVLIKIASKILQISTTQHLRYEGLYNQYLDKEL